MPNCRTCGANIIWVKTESGKNMPVDYDEEIKNETNFDSDRMQSHFSTCKDANKWRKER